MSDRSETQARARRQGLPVLVPRGDARGPVR